MGHLGIDWWCSHLYLHQATIFLSKQKKVGNYLLLCRLHITCTKQKTDCGPASSQLSRKLQRIFSARSEASFLRTIWTWGCKTLFLEALHFLSNFSSLIYIPAALTFSRPQNYLYPWVYSSNFSTLGHNIFINRSSPNNRRTYLLAEFF